MTARDLFGVLVRLIGFLLCLYSLVWVFYAAVLLLGLPPSQGDHLGLSAWIAYLAVGLLVLATAGPVTRLMYGRAQPDA